MSLRLALAVWALLICSATCYAIEGSWVSDSYPDSVITVRAEATSQDATNIYQLSVNSCALAYNLQLDQSYLSLLNFPPNTNSNICARPNSSLLASHLEQKIMHFYITYNKLGLVSIFGNSTTSFTRLASPPNPSPLAGRYQDSVTG